MIKQVLYLESAQRLNIENNQLKISLTDKKEETKEIHYRPLEDIGVVILDSPRIILTSAVVSGLIKNGAIIVSCDEKHLPSGLMIDLSGNSLQTERFLCQMNVSLPLKKRLWQQTVCGKIKNQACVLRLTTGENHPKVIRLIDKVKSGDPDNIEAQAASYYWKNLIDSPKKFKRDRFGEDPNALLNYGYTILRSIVARALVSTGLHPTLGIYHKNKYNPLCLADDIMEPYRPYIDLFVVEIINSMDNPTLDNREVKKRLLSVSTIDVTIDGKVRPLMVGVSETTASLYKCYSGESRRIKYPEMKLSPDA